MVGIPPLLKVEDARIHLTEALVKVDHPVPQLKTYWIRIIQKYIELCQMKYIA